MIDTAKLERIFRDYPKLAVFITAGNISLKMAREIIGIDRYEMYAVFLDLVETGAINVTSGSNSFRATPELREYMRQRSEGEVHEQANC